MELLIIYVLVCEGFVLAALVTPSAPKHQHVWWGWPLKFVLAPVLVPAAVILAAINKGR